MTSAAVSPAAPNSVASASAARSRVAWERLAGLGLHGVAGLALDEVEIDRFDGLQYLDGGGRNLLPDTVPGDDCDLVCHGRTSTAGRKEGVDIRDGDRPARADLAVTTLRSSPVARQSHS